MDCLNDRLRSLAGLCALSVNHSNSYLAYPGSATIGEITLYDANGLVSLHLASSERKQIVALVTSLEKPCFTLLRPPPLEHPDADPSSRQSPRCPRLQHIRYKVGQCFREGEEGMPCVFLVFFYANIYPNVKTFSTTGNRHQGLQRS